MSNEQREIIFFDTEFTHLNIMKGELLSIGMVKESGEELYLEFEYSGDNVHPWVEKKVLPYLNGEHVSVEEGRGQLKKFIGDEKPYIMSYVNQFDAMYWYRLFGDPKDHPAFWIPLDFASILFAQGYDPESMREESFFEKLNIDKSQYNQHNALDDAKLLSKVYDAFKNIKKS